MALAKLFRALRGRRIAYLLLAVGTGVSGQDFASLPRFEVASIRLSRDNSTGSQNDFNGSNVVFQNYVLGGILQTAFQVDRLSLEAPPWIYDERFDITAKVSDDQASIDERLRMLQALLIDRFGLVFHRETRSRAGFALVISKGGPKIRRAPDDGSQANDNRPGRMQRLRTTISSFASALSSVLRQPVVDETNMDGRYDVTLTYAPEGGGALIEAVEGPSIFTAIEEQLGLKLEPRNLPVEVFVIDRLEKLPTDN